MIITRTPYRVSLFGGGTDHPEHYATRGGSVLGFALDQYCYLTVRKLPPFFRHKHRVVYSRIEEVGGAEEIEHLVVRAVMRRLSWMIGDDGLEIHHDGDVPARAGLGSSSSFTCGLLQAIRALYGRRSDPLSLAAEAVLVERNLVGDVVGDQDQLFAAVGGVNRIEFTPEGPEVYPLILPAKLVEQLSSMLMLVYVGESRLSTEAAAAQVSAVERNAPVLDEMARMARRAEGYLRAARLDEVGRMLDRAWALKRSLTPKISTSLVDELYGEAVTAGALGGKLLGAGGGGFVLLFVEHDKQQRVRAALRAAAPNLVEVPAGVAPQGTTVVLNGLHA